jgi:hypothetical protein
MAYTVEKMAAAKKRTIEAKKVAGESGRIGKSGRMTMQVDQEAYFNAVDRNGGVDDSGKTIWSDSGFRKDMMKRHPEIVVAAEKAGCTVGPMMGRDRKNYSDIFGKGRFDDVEADPDALFAGAKELAQR